MYVYSSDVKSGAHEEGDFCPLPFLVFKANQARKHGLAWIKSASHPFEELAADEHRLYPAAPRPDLITRLISPPVVHEGNLQLWPL